MKMAPARETQKQRTRKLRQGGDPGQDGQMGLSDHLRELRNRILVCALVLAAAMVIGMGVVRQVVGFLLALGERYDYEFVYISPQELLMEYFSVDLLLAVCIALPVVLYEVWAFLRPGLKKSERVLFLLVMAFGLLSACVGIFFAYRILVPFLLYFLITLGEGSGVRASVSVQNYISFLLTLFLVFAMVFELPVVSLLLTWLRILKVAWMRKFRKIAVVAIFFIAAVITPPDIVSQIMVAVPLLFLYELSIVICSLADRFHKPEA